MKPKSTPSKKKRRKPTLDEMEAIEHEDWLEDLRQREANASVQTKEKKERKK